MNNKKVIIGIFLTICLTFVFSGYYLKVVPKEAAAASRKTVLASPESTQAPEQDKKNDELLPQASSSNKFEGYLKCCDEE